MEETGAYTGLLPPERRAKILDLVQRNKSVLVKELCIQFGVTGETIRKDLASLELNGTLIKTYGGAYIQEGVKNEIDASIRETLYPEAKASIGQTCAHLVGSGDTIFLDESTTSLSVARNLLQLDALTAVTNSLKIAKVFAESGSGKLLLSGGELDRKNQCFVGGSAEEMLGTYFVDKSFVSCRGADRAAGITDGSAVNGRVRRLMLQHARERFLILDHTKLDLINFYQIGTFELIDAVVVDYLPSALWRAFFDSNHIRVIETMARQS